MTDITYGIVEERYYLNGNERISYGIAVYPNADAEGIATVISSVHDVTCTKPKLLELVEKCNRLKLSPLHLEDVIEDFFAD